MPLLIAIVVLLLLWFEFKKDSTSGSSSASINSGNNFLVGGAAGAINNGSPDYGDDVASYGRQDALDNILEAIKRFEGGRPGDANVRDNNPMNLRDSPLAAGYANDADGRTAYFQDEGDGWDAATGQVNSWVQRNPGWNLRDLVNQILGPNRDQTPENQAATDRYAQYVSSYAGIPVDATLSELLGIG